MRVLLITQDYFPIANATSNCAEILMNNLDCSEKYVAVINSENSNTVTSNGNITIKYIKKKKLKTVLANNLKNRRHFFEMLFLSLKVLYCTRVKKNESSSRHVPTFVRFKSGQLIDELAETVRENAIDVIITICAPAESIYIGKKLKDCFPQLRWIAYYLDPLCTNYNFTESRETAEKLEYLSLKSADRIMMLDLIYEDYKKTRLNEYISKSVITELPTVKEHIRSTTPSKLEHDKDRISCLYMGNLYRNIRNPEFMFHLIESAGEKIHLSVFGTWYNGENCAINAPNISMHSPVSLDEAFDLMLDGDILVNIGNTVENQMPSKIMDYISTGKPIVNICKIRNCPTLRFTKKYPLALNIFEEDGLTETVISAFVDFCIKNKGKQIPYEIIKNIYKACTAEAVVEQFAAVLKDASNENHQTTDT